MLLTSRKNAMGTGADRRDLPTYLTKPFKSEKLTELVLGVVKSLPDTFNDIQSEQSYQIASKSPLKSYFPPKYRQILLQHHTLDSRGEEEQDYVVDAYPEIMQIIKQVFPYCYRTRIVILPPGEVLGMHIDSNTSVSCRFHIPITGMSEWVVRRVGVEERFMMGPPDIWFVNTGYPHQVSNIGSVDRISIALGCHYDNVHDFFKV